jgi:hypothetical protein
MAAFLQTQRDRGIRGRAAVKSNDRKQEPEYDEQERYNGETRTAAGECQSIAAVFIV